MIFNATTHDPCPRGPGLSPLQAQIATKIAFDQRWSESALGGGGAQNFAWPQGPTLSKSGPVYMVLP